MNQDTEFILTFLVGLCFGIAVIKFVQYLGL